MIEMKNKRFENGKCYRHKNGRELKVIGMGDSSIYGICFIGEERDGSFAPLGFENVNFQGWFEITNEEFEKGFKED